MLDLYSEGVGEVNQRDYRKSRSAATIWSRREGIRSRLAALTVAAIVTVNVAGCGAGNENDADSLTVGVTDINAPFAPLHWAAVKGYFKNAGLNLKIEVGHASTSAQLVSGQTDVYVGSQGSLFGIANSGKPVSTIYGIDSGLQSWVVTSKESIKTPADCKTITSAVPGTIVYAWTKQLEEVFDADWDITQLTTAASVSANIAAGRTDCANGNIAWFLSAIKENKARVIVDPTDKPNLPSDWPSLGVEDVIAGLPKTLDEKRPAVEKFLKAYDAGVRDYIKTDSRDIAETLISHDSDWAAGGSTDVLAEGIEQLKPLLSPNDGQISAQLWSNTITFFGKGGLGFLENDPSRFGYDKSVDMSYYKAAAIGTK